MFPARAFLRFFCLFRVDFYISKTPLNINEYLN